HCLSCQHIFPALGQCKKFAQVFLSVDPAQSLLGGGATGTAAQAGMQLNPQLAAQVSAKNFGLDKSAQPAPAPMQGDGQDQVWQMPLLHSIAMPQTGVQRLSQQTACSELTAILEAVDQIIQGRLVAERDDGLGKGWRGMQALPAVFGGALFRQWQSALTARLRRQVRKC